MGEREMKKLVCYILTIGICLTLISCGDPKKHEGQAKTPSGSSIQKGRMYDDVVKDFEEHGFKNIKPEPIDDLVLGWLKKDGEVEKVSVDGDFEYSPDKWVDENVEVVIQYHTYSIDEDESENDHSVTESKVEQPAEVKNEESSKESEQSVAEDTSKFQEGKLQTPGMIVMDKSSDEYVTERWNVDELVKHFEDMGFQNIELIKRQTDNDELLNTVSDISVDHNGCRKGQECIPENLIEIGYFTPRILTIENCPELLAVFTTREGLQEFVEKYDGYIVEFNALLTDRSIGYGEDIITVKGEDAEGNVGDGYNIHIGDRTINANIDRNLEVGDEVYVLGRISDRWCEYYRYNTFYLETEVLSIR